jgi:hypothetical protein
MATHGGQASLNVLEALENNKRNDKQGTRMRDVGGGASEWNEKENVDPVRLQQLSMSTWHHYFRIRTTKRFFVMCTTILCRFSSILCNSIMVWIHTAIWVRKRERALRWCFTGHWQSSWVFCASISHIYWRAVYSEGSNLCNSAPIWRFGRCKQHARREPPSGKCKLANKVEVWRTQTS